MKIRKNINVKITYKDFLYFGALFLFSIFNIATKSTLLNDVAEESQIIIRLIKGSIIFLLLTKVIFLDKYKSKEIILYGLIMVMILISAYNSKSLDVFWFYIFIISAKDISLDKAVKFVTINLLTFVIMIIVLAQLKIIDNITVMAINPITKRVVERHYLGFDHVNNLGGFILCIFLGIMYFRFQKYNFYDVLGSIILSIIVYYYINSKTTAFVILFSIFLVWFLKMLIKTERGSKYIGITIFSIMIIALSMSIFSCVFYNNMEIIKKFDNLLSYRFRWGNYFYKNYGFSIIGQNLKFITQNRNRMEYKLILDNAFMTLGIRYGVSVFVLIILNYFLLANYSIKLKQYSLAIIISLLFLVAISEQWLFVFNYNYFLIATINYRNLYKESMEKLE